MPGPRSFDAIILGAGAAGLIARRWRGSAGAVLLIDHAERAGQEDPHFGRRTLQLHQYPRRARALPLGQPAFRQVGAGPLHARAISSPWSSATASPGTRRRSANCSATARPGRSSPCCCDECAAAGSRLALGHPAQRSSTATARFASRSAATRRDGAGAGPRHAAALRSPRWARPASLMILRAASA